MEAVCWNRNIRGNVNDNMAADALAPSVAKLSLASTVHDEMFQILFMIPNNQLNTTKVCPVSPICSTARIPVHEINNAWRCWSYHFPNSLLGKAMISMSKHICIVVCWTKVFVIFFTVILKIDRWCISCEIVLRWMRTVSKGDTAVMH